jgi:hypothetical protein
MKFLNTGMPDLSTIGQSGNGMRKKAYDAETGPVRNRAMQSTTFWTGTGLRGWKLEC